MFRTVVLALALSLGASSSPVKLVSYDGADGTVALSEFKELNDPVMGGRSTGTFTLDEAAKAGVFDGEVVDVPSLSAPGFIKTAADGKYPDASASAGGDLVLTVRTTTPEYAGFRVSIAAGATSAAYACSGGGSLPFSRGCFKAPFVAPAGDNFAEVRVPLSAFSDKWSPATGDITTTCADDASACVDADALAAVQRVEIWAEGALGAAHLEIQSVAVAPPATAVVGVSPPADQNLCSGPVQDNLLYGFSGRTTPAGVLTNPPVDQNESLAEAVCCDKRALATAEPMFTYAAPDISLYAKMDANGTTTFYDSVCGVPLFRAPVGRTRAEFEADTDEHGWPSFREEEIVRENLVGGGVDDASERVFSSCGTHLGSFLPDAEGDRWCIDLSCISGQPMDA